MNILEVIENARRQHPKYASVIEEAARREGKLPPKPKPDPWKSDLGRAIRKRQTSTASPTPKPTSSAPERVRHHYVRDGGREEWVRGAWVPRDEKFWAQASRYAGPSRVLEVGDLPGRPTVLDHPTYGRVVVRGCAICGVKEVVRPSTPIKVGRLAGTLCVECHRQWLEMSTAQRRDLPRWVTRRVREEGFLDPSLPEVEVVRHSATRSEEVPLVLTGWRRYLWASRVLRSSDPAIQQPVSQPFGFLAGPIKVEEVST